MIQPGVSKHLLLYFVEELGEGDCHLALLSRNASMDCDVSTFTGQGEVVAQGYAAGGKRLQGFSCGLDDGIAWAAWNSVDWMNASIRACGAVIYQKAKGNRIVAVLDFGEEKVSSQGLFRVKLPAPGAKGAVFWLA